MIIRRYKKQRKLRKKKKVIVKEDDNINIVNVVKNKNKYLNFINKINEHLLKFYKFKNEYLRLI